MNYKRIITIIICAYNAEKRLRKTLESIISQNKIMDIVDQIILVDNNSTDNTKNIMNEYIKYDFIRYVFEKKQGLSFARLTGIVNSKTEWIVFVDDDNVLQKNWIAYAYDYIEKNENIGAFNGAVIPEINDKLTEEEDLILKITYRGLACTHLKEDNIDTMEAIHPHEVPFGAGLVIKAEPLKLLAQNGWLSVTGRKGNSLGSGEDTEMCLFIKKSGYEFGYNPRMIIKHLIPRFRLNMQYSIKLYKGFAEYQVYRMKKEGSLYKIHQKILFFLRLVRSLVYSYISLRKEKKIKWILNLAFDKHIFISLFSMRKVKTTDFSQ